MSNNSIPQSNLQNPLHKKLLHKTGVEVVLNEGQSVPLGTYTDTVDARVQKAILKQDLLSAAKELLPNEKRLQACLALRVDADHPVGLDYADNTEAPKARLTNVCRCDNPHLCPNCGPIISEKKRRLLQEDMTVWSLEGYTSCFVVFTLQHFSWEVLGEVDKRIDQSIKRMFDSRAGRAFKSEWSICGRSRSPDVTFGENGWHSHRNFILYLERRPLSDKERINFERELSELWQGSVNLEGGYADIEHGCKIRFDDVFDVAEYIASKALGVELSAKGRLKSLNGDGRQWGQAEEVTKSHLKQARGTGCTPLGLLEAYLWGDQQAGFLFQEYAAVFKGKKFVDTSPGFRKRLDELKEKHEGDLLEVLGQDELPDYQTLAYFGPDAFAQLVKLSMVLWLLEETKACGGDASLIRDFLQDAGICQVYYPTLEPHPPDWWYVIEGDEVSAEGVREFNEFIRRWNGGS